MIDSIIFPAPTPSYSFRHFVLPKGVLVHIPRAHHDTVACYIQGDPTKVKGYAEFNEEERNRFTLLYAHANAEDIGMVREELFNLSRAIGVDVLMVEYTGYGLVRGHANPDNAVTDVVAAYRFLTQTVGIPTHLIIPTGRSIGSGSATMLADAYPCGGVILLTPFTSLRDAVYSTLAPKLGSLIASVGTKVVDNHFPNLEKIQKMQMPVLIFHGTIDSIVPYSHGVQIRDSNPKNVQLITLNNVDHNDIDLVEHSGKISEFLERVREWNTGIPALSNRPMASKGCRVSPLNPEASKGVVTFNSIGEFCEEHDNDSRETNLSLKTDEMVMSPSARCVYNHKVSTFEVHIHLQRGLYQLPQQINIEDCFQDIISFSYVVYREVLAFSNIVLRLHKALSTELKDAGVISGSVRATIELANMLWGPPWLFTRLFRTTGDTMRWIRPSYMVKRLPSYETIAKELENWCPSKSRVPLSFSWALPVMELAPEESFMDALVDLCEHKQEGLYLERMQLAVERYARQVIMGATRNMKREVFRLNGGAGSPRSAIDWPKFLVTRKDIAMSFDPSHGNQSAATPLLAPMLDKQFSDENLSGNRPRSKSMSSSHKPEQPPELSLMQAYCNLAKSTRTGQAIEDLKRPYVSYMTKYSHAITLHVDETVVPWYRPHQLDQKLSFSRNTFKKLRG